MPPTAEAAKAFNRQLRQTAAVLAGPVRRGSRVRICLRVWLRANREAHAARVPTGGVARGSKVTSRLKPLKREAELRLAEHAALRRGQVERGAKEASLPRSQMHYRSRLSSARLWREPPEQVANMPQILACDGQRLTVVEREADRRSSHSWTITIPHGSEPRRFYPRNAGIPSVWGGSCGSPPSRRSAPIVPVV
jgi:hypothetical protein